MLDINEIEPTVNMNKVKISQHALERFKERMSIKDHSKAMQLVKYILSNGEFLGEIVGENDEKNCLYSYKGNMLLLNKSNWTVITVMKKDYEYTHEKLRNQFVSLGAKEIRKLNRQERTLCRRLDEFKLDYNLQVALIEKRIHRTRSNNVKVNCQKERDELDYNMIDLKKKIREVQEEKRRVAYSLSLII